MHPRTIAFAAFTTWLGLSLYTGCSSNKGGTFPGDDDGGSSGGSSSSGSSGNTSSSGSVASSGSGSGGTTSSASSSGGHPSSSGGSGGASSGNSSSAFATDASMCTPTTMCGTIACDLKTHDCCLSQALTVTCVAKGGCPPLTAAFGCLSECDCTTAGQVCCGNANSQTNTASTSCQTVSASEQCPGTISMASGFAQICETTSECKNNMPCIPQTCNATNPPAKLTMCGLQSQSPFDCAAGQ